MGAYACREYVRPANDDADADNDERASEHETAFGMKLGGRLSRFATTLHRSANPPESQSMAASVGWASVLLLAVERRSTLAECEHGMGGVGAPSIMLLSS